MTISWNGNKCLFVVEDDTPNQMLNAQTLKEAVDAVLLTTTVEYTVVDYDDETSKTIAKIVFESEPSNEDKANVESVIVAHLGVPSVKYKVWCNACSKWYEGKAPTLPTECSECFGNVVNITDEQFAVRGYSISKEMPEGHCVFNLENNSNNRWTRYKQYVQFPAKLETIPSTILLSNVILDGFAGLTVENITVRGFLFSVNAVNKGKNWGFGGIEFDWKAVN